MNEHSNLSSSSVLLNNSESVSFAPKKALILGKFSRYDFEKLRYPNLSENDLIKMLEKRGSDYQTLLYHHNINLMNRNHIVQCLNKRNIETKVVDRLTYSEKLISWADMIITSGGDGTYLLAANKLNDPSKPLIGVNSDPSRSVGHLCLPNQYSNDFDRALNLILSGHFEWYFRQRIRITLDSENAFDDPIELHDQQLLHPEYRFWELDQGTSPRKPQSKSESSNSKKRIRLLPFRALNEVFVGESLSSRVSYFELSINDEERNKIKSSGITICTGTGSTSWFFNINKLTPQCVQNLFKIINEECFKNKPLLSSDDRNLVQKITDRFNNSLTYSPSETIMAYVIRDPVVWGTNFNSNPRDFAKKIVVKSRMTDAHIVIDGGLSYAFNDGSMATFEMLEEDVLRTIKLKD